MWNCVRNLSASDELIGKNTYLRQLLAQQSARTMAGYVYAGCGFGESTQDVVYGGNAYVYENGKCLAESERFSFESQLVISQIDYEKLRSDRRNNTTFVNAQRNVNNKLNHESFVRFVDCQSINPKDFTLLRKVNPTPFIPESEPA